MSKINKNTGVPTKMTTTMVVAYTPKAQKHERSWTLHDVINTARLEGVFLRQSHGGGLLYAAYPAR